MAADYEIRQKNKGIPYKYLRRGISFSFIVKLYSFKLNNSIKFEKPISLICVRGQVNRESTFVIN